MRIAINFLLALCFSVSAFSASQAFFIPPKKWELADPKHLSPRIKVAFFTPAQSGFTPSLNLAEEEIDVSSADYLKSVQAIHEADPVNTWRNLGKIETVSGEAFLTEIDVTTSSGSLRMFQMIFVKDQKAYILTAAAPKETFSNYLSAFQKSFRSFQVTDNLLSCVSDPDKRAHLEAKLAGLQEALKNTSFQDKIFQKKTWIPFEKTVQTSCADLGAHFQLLMLKEASGITTANSD